MLSKYLVAALAALHGYATASEEITDELDTRSPDQDEAGLSEREVIVHGSSSRYLTEVCSGLYNESDPDPTPALDLPCNAISAIFDQCMLGPQLGMAYYLARFQGKRNVTINGQTLNFTRILRQEQSNSTQRVCFCTSQYFDQSAACRACYVEHGLVIPPSANRVQYVFGFSSFSDPVIEEGFSSSYCAVTNTPTADFAGASYAYWNHHRVTTTNPWGGYATNLPAWLQSSLKSAQSATSTAGFTDPLENKTDVGLYYTPSVTGSRAWMIPSTLAMTTGPTGGEELLTRTTGSGQIMPTATPDTTITHSALPSKFSERVDGLQANATAPSRANGAKEKRAPMLAMVFAMAIAVLWF